MRNEYPPDFETFFKSHPRRIAKGQAYTTWKRYRDVPLDVILEALDRCKAEWERERRPKHLIPHPSTWLNQRRWEDDLCEDAGYRTPDVSAGLDDGPASDVPTASSGELPF